jgi:prolyl 4-hydroxylase
LKHKFSVYFFGIRSLILTHSVPVISVKPRKGDALLFFSLHLNATTDTTSLHGSCPVIEGEKWSATKWIHVADFMKPIRLPSDDDGDCVDENENFARWAKVGECEKNPLYMVGKDGVKGKCMKSCNVCSSSS